MTTGRTRSTERAAQGHAGDPGSTESRPHDPESDFTRSSGIAPGRANPEPTPEPGGVVVGPIETNGTHRPRYT
ncbi:MAG: hypothetical protein K8E66_13875, partial [Phycisphaerales bacterium]|nr:hypothetical protein [Phycisphaerales bacterium]